MSRIRIVERTGSTNADLLADHSAVEGDWLVARSQHSGRGRQGRTWESAEGNFLGSTMVTLKVGDPPPATLSLAAGVALIRAVEAAAPATGLILKWPNDLLMGPGKLAGIPPLFGFWPKLMVFTAAVDAGFVALAVAGIVGTVIGAYYYLRVIKFMYFDTPAEAYARRFAPIETALLVAASVIVSPLGYLLIGPLGQWTDRAAGSLF